MGRFYLPNFIFPIPPVHFSIDCRFSAVSTCTIPNNRRILLLVSRPHSNIRAKHLPTCPALEFRPFAQTSPMPTIILSNRNSAEPLTGTLGKSVTLQSGLEFQIHLDLFSGLRVVLSTDWSLSIPKSGTASWLCRLSNRAFSPYFPTPDPCLASKLSLRLRSSPTPRFDPRWCVPVAPSDPQHRSRCYERFASCCALRGRSTTAAATADRGVLRLRESKPQNQPSPTSTSGACPEPATGPTRPSMQTARKPASPASATDFETPNRISMRSADRTD